MFNIGIGLNKRIKEMEKRCEFCKALKVTVYCKSDAAYLCLSCDTKVHSANALSFRHPCTLVCESCNYHPAVFRCSVHRMFVCQICDDVIHRHDGVGGFQYQKKVLGCYMGCPSAKDLASLWGFDSNDLENNNSIECEGGSSSRVTKVVEDDKRDQNSYSILQQILYLEKLQLSDEIDDPHLVHVKEHKTINNNNSNNNNNNNNNNPVDHFDGNLEFRQTEESLEEKKDERLLSPFSQLEDHLTSSNGNHLSFWQYKSPAQNNNEIWLQNMQDIGVCDEIQSFDDDDVTIPDVDLTFRNIEELFGSEHEPSLKFDQDPSYGMLEYQEHDWISPTFYDQQQLPHGSSYNSKKSNLHGNENVILRNKEKKVLRHEKQAYYTCPKSKSEVKKRGKGEVY